MIRFSLLFCFSFYCLFLFSQHSDTDNDPEKRYRELIIKVEEGFREKTDLKKIESWLLEAVDLYNQSGEKMKGIPADYLASDYYNLACVYSLQKNKKKALDAFQKCADAGYKDYMHALQDTDLDFVRKEKRFVQSLEKLRERGDYLYILRNDAGYAKEENKELPEFIYEEPGNWRIRNVKEYFNLDSVAGKGDEISRIMNVMEWVHNTIPHDGSHWPNCEIDAVDIYNYSKANNNRGVNCRALAIVLNECYLSLGIPSRFMTCLPKDRTDPDCHVINAVYSQTLDKWVWMDPSFNACVKDENGVLLSIAEVRDRLIDNAPLYLNEDANWNNQTKQTKEYYLDSYMAKNLYWFQCPVRQIFNVETRYRNTNEKYISLIPVSYEPDNIGSLGVVTRNPEYFWQKPTVSK